MNNTRGGYECLILIEFHCVAFAGEHEVESAKNVMLHTSLSKKRYDRDNGISGRLVVTNFKLTFLSGENDQVFVYPID